MIDLLLIKFDQLNDNMLEKRNYYPQYSKLYKFFDAHFVARLLIHAKVNPINQRYKRHKNLKQKLHQHFFPYLFTNFFTYLHCSINT
jgi:hypothetical protein